MCTQSRSIVDKLVLNVYSESRQKQRAKSNKRSELLSKKTERSSRLSRAELSPSLIDVNIAPIGTSTTIKKSSNKDKITLGALQSLKSGVEMLDLSVKSLSSKLRNNIPVAKKTQLSKIGRSQSPKINRASSVFKSIKRRLSRSIKSVPLEDRVSQADSFQWNPSA